MPTKPISDEELQETVNTYARLGTNTATAAELGVEDSTVRRRRKMAADRGITPKLDDASQAAELPNFPDDDVSAEEILGMMEKRFEKRLQHQKSLRWFRSSSNPWSRSGLLSLAIRTLVLTDATSRSCANTLN